MFTGYWQQHRVRIELWALPNVLLKPHMAGHRPYLDERRFEIMADNCRAFAVGHPLRNQVDKASWF